MNVQWQQSIELIWSYSVGVVVHSGDVCNQQMLDHLFDHHKFEYVVHMAGKDGGSMESPDAFIRANTQCLLTLLRVLSSHKVF